MNTPVTIAVVAVSVLLLVWSLVTCLRNRPIGTPHLAGSALLTLLALVQLVVEVVTMAGGDRPGGGVPTFVGYLLGCLLLPPAAAFLGLAERSRWGSAVVAAGALVEPILVLRLYQVWETTRV